MTRPAETRSYEYMLSDIEQSAYLRGHAAAMSTCRACAAIRRPLYLACGLLAALIWVLV